MYFIFAVGRGPGSLCTLYTVHGAKGGARAQFRQKYAFFLAHFLLKTNVTFVYRTQKSFFYIRFGQRVLKERKRPHIFV